MIYTVQEAHEAFNAAYCMPPRPLTQRDSEYWEAPE